MCEQRQAIGCLLQGIEFKPVLGTSLANLKLLFKTMIWRDFVPQSSVIGDFRGALILLYCAPIKQVIRFMDNEQETTYAVISPVSLLAFKPCRCLIRETKLMHTFKVVQWISKKAV